MEYDPRPGINAALEKLHAALAAKDAEIKELRGALDEIYPSIAGRVIALQQAGEEKAAEHWNNIAVKVHTAITAGLGETS